ncbi:MAG: 4Fe-4S binding protein [Spirochaetales bacterium]|nr:4Fe-4S binding protein [Spirochaetales bacterium]
MAKDKKKSARIRLVVQILFFLVVTLIVTAHNLVEIGVEIPLIGSASIHSICPFGGVVSIYEFFVSGSFVKKIHESSFILMAIVFLLSLLAGPVFCGWVCPFGSFQEWIAKLGKKIFKKRFNHFIPYKIDKYLRFLRYVVLVWVIYMTATSGQLLFQNIDPFYTLFNFYTSEMAISGYIVFGVIVVLGFFVERPFCKYACPYGALLGIFNLFRLFGIKRNAATCIDCKACDKICPMNIPISDKSTIRNHQCITCMKCSSEQSCPVPDTLNLEAGKAKKEAKDDAA